MEKFKEKSWDFGIMESRGIFSVVREFLCYQEYDLAKIVILGILEGLISGIFYSSRRGAPQVHLYECFLCCELFTGNCGSSPLLDHSKYHLNYVTKNRKRAFLTEREHVYPQSW